MKSVARSQHHVQALGLGLIAAVGLGVGPIPSATAQPPTLRLGAWNIEWLGSPGQRSGPARNVAQTPEDLAAYIQAAGVDILALEEIGDDNGDPDTRTNATLTRAFERLERDTSRAWDYRLLPKKSNADTTQLTGVAWDRGKLEFVGEVRVPSLDVPNNDFNEWDRSAHGVKLSAGPGLTDLVVIPVHMKSNRGGVAKTRLQRGLEANLLVAQLDFVRQHFEDDDIVILGDSNCLNKDEVAIQTFVSAGFVDLNAADTPTLFNGNAPFDRIFVTGGQGEFANSAMTVHKTLAPADHKKRLSDHYMVTTTIDVRPDEDVVSGAPVADVDDAIMGARTVAGAEAGLAPGAGVAYVLVPVPIDGTGRVVAPLIAGAMAGRGVALAPEAEPAPAAPAVARGSVRIARLQAATAAAGGSITLRNLTDEPIALDGWILRDRGQGAGRLEGVLEPRGERTVAAGPTGPVLGARGGRVDLLDPAGRVADRVLYQNAADGRTIDLLGEADPIWP
jgi:endonuclease/exonuclease/phosphatase family metal-dependent hydrolase